MPTILYDNHLISADKLKEHSRLLHKIANGEIKAPQATMLHGVKYQKYDVAHARINKKERIIYTHIIHKGERTLFILDVLENHNYPQLSRKFKNRITGIEPYIKEYLPKDEELFGKAVDSRQDNLDEKEMPLTYTAVTNYNNMHLQLDESQNKAVQLTTPAVILGPPGAGKTAVLFVLLLNFLKNLLKQILPETAAATPATTAAVATPTATAAPTSIATATAAAAPKPATPAAEVLFVSPSHQLINNLKNTYEQTSDVAVRFSTWRDLLQSYYKDCTLVTEQAFKEFYQQYFKAGEEPQKVHYELSLFAALGKEDYLKLGKRQSHFSGNKEQQTQIEKLFTLWGDLLKKHKLIDPLFTMLPKSAKEYITFCDETQNLPPTALRSLIQYTKDKHFVAALDSEQCILTSPFIHNCLQQLLFKRFGTANEHLLEQTWRCPPAVVDFANRVLEFKYEKDKEAKNKRVYTTLKSSMDTQGLVSLVDENNYKKLKAYGENPTTVVIAAKKPSEEERELIKKELNCVHILTAEEAIGLDFAVVILWKPLSTGPLTDFIKAPKPGLKPEQWHGLNALYVASTRAQAALFICEPRLNKHTEKLFGTLPVNQFHATVEQISAETKNKILENQIQHHELAGRWTLASELIGQLDLPTEQIKKRRAELEERRNGNTRAPSQTTAQDFKWNPAPSKSNDEKEMLFSAPKAQTEKTQKTKAKITTKSQEAFNKYVIALLQNPTKERIKNLFVDRKAMQYLFQYPLPNPYPQGRFLFRELINRCSSNKEVLHGIAENLTHEIMTGPAHVTHFNNALELLTNAESEQAPLLAMLLHNPNLAKIIDGGLLCQLNGHGNTPLGHLSNNSDEGVSILELLLKNNPKLAQEITAEALCRPIPRRTRPAEGSSLVFLAMTYEGFHFLEALLKRNHQLARGITAEALCRPLPKEANDAHCSPLMVLAWSEEGRELLRQLLNINPELAKGITAKALLLALPKEAEKYAHVYPLYFLLHTEDGQFIFKAILEANPQLALEITAEDLCRPLPADAEAEAVGYSPLYSLANRPHIFKALLTKNPELSKGITSEALCRPIPGKVGIEKCPLFRLMGLPEGLEILNTLLDTTADLAQKIYEDDEVQRSISLITPKSLLVTDPIGQKVLKKIQQGGKQKLSTASQVQVVTLQPALAASAAQIGFFPPASAAQPQTAVSSGLDCKSKK